MAVGFSLPNLIISLILVALLIAGIVWWVRTITRSRRSGARSRSGDQREHPRD